MSSDRQPSYLTSLISGGIAGTSVDVALFPLDTIKTRMQVGLPPHDTSTARELARELLCKAGGSAAPLYSGLPAMLLRAFPSTGAMMLAVELTNGVFCER